MISQKYSYIFPKIDTFLLEQGVDWYTRILSTEMSKFEHKISISVLANYIVNAHLGLLRQFLADDMPYSSEYMARQLSLLTFEGSFSLLKILH